MNQALYSASKNKIITILADGVCVYSKQTLQQTLDLIKNEFPDAKVMEIDEAVSLHEAGFKTEPIEITEQQFDDALAELPPLHYRKGDGFRSFKCYEFTSGNVTAIYLQQLNPLKSWAFSDTFTLTHQDIIKKVLSTVQ